MLSLSKVKCSQIHVHTLTCQVSSSEEISQTQTSQHSVVTWCSVALSFSTAASAGFELLTLWTFSHTHTYNHHTQMRAHTQDRETGLGLVTFHCLSGLGPGPPTGSSLQPTPSLLSPFSSCSRHPGWTCEVRSPSHWFNVVRHKKSRGRRGWIQWVPEWWNKQKVEKTVEEVMRKIKRGLRGKWRGGNVI